MRHQITLDDFLCLAVLQVVVLSDAMHASSSHGG